jgi:hypothetical protein
MKTRIRDKWRDRNRQGSLEDNATSLAYGIWQIALAAAKNLHVEDFDYESDEQRTAVIAEYLMFLVHVADRFAFEQMNAESRKLFITTLAQHTARHYQRNVVDIMGRGDYRSGYIEKLNARAAEYAETPFSDGDPGYETRRCLGEKIQEVMGMTQINKWVIQQVIDLDAPEAVKHLKTTMGNLFGTSNIDPQPASKEAVIGAD